MKLKERKQNLIREIRYLSDGMLCVLSGEKTYDGTREYEYALIEFVEKNYKRYGFDWNHWQDVVNCHRREKLRKELFAVDDSILITTVPELILNGITIEMYRERLLNYLDCEYKREAVMHNWLSWHAVVWDYEKTLKRNQKKKAA